MALARSKTLVGVQMVESRPHALMTPSRILLGALKGKAVLWLKFQIRALAGR